MNHQFEVVHQGIQQDILTKMMMNDLQQLGAQRVLEQIGTYYDKAAMTFYLDYMGSKDGRTAVSRENATWAAQELLRLSQSSSQQSNPAAVLMHRAQLKALAILASSGQEIPRMLRQMHEEAKATQEAQAVPASQ